MDRKAQQHAATGGARRSGLMASVAERLRERVFAAAPDTLIGSLPELAQALDVGIVTIQQAARILEHEGLLQVRRGPKGGYYGRRPDADTIETALAAYMRMHPDSYSEVLDITSLLFIELCGAAAQCTDDALREELRDLSPLFRTGGVEVDLAAVETRLQDLLFRMVDRPIFEMLTRVTLRFATARGSSGVHEGDEADERWFAGRRRIIDAIYKSDEALARFEADRSNRQVLIARRTGLE